MYSLWDTWVGVSKKMKQCYKRMLSEKETVKLIQDFLESGDRKHYMCYRYLPDNFIGRINRTIGVMGVSLWAERTGSRGFVIRRIRNAKKQENGTGGKK